MRATAILVALCGAAALQLPLPQPNSANHAAAIRTTLAPNQISHRAFRTPPVAMSETPSRQGLWGTGDAPECC